MLQCLPSFTDLLGTLFPLWQDSLALPTYVRLTFFVCVPSLILLDGICHRAQLPLVFYPSSLIHAVACGGADDKAGSVWP